MHNRLAHTAEHAFIGSLQKILGTILEVRKVEHREKDSSVIVRLSNLDLQTITDAQREVNSLIRVGRKVKPTPLKQWMMQENISQVLELMRSE